VEPPDSVWRFGPQTIGGQKYFGFVLDANERSSLISVDNFRVYTSSTITTGSVQNDVTKLDNLGTLRCALNNPTLNGTTPPVDLGFNIDNWIKLNAAPENLDVQANGGSGMADMVVYIPATVALIGVGLLGLGAMRRTMSKLSKTKRNSLNELKGSPD
jgi:hypothetical protein